jgi:MFS family permease
MCRPDTLLPASSAGSSSSSSRAHSSTSCPCSPLRRYNRNVVLTWISGALEGAGDSVWNGTVLVALIYEIMGQSNTYAGYVEAVQGLTSLVVGLPVGHIADKSSKSRVIAFGALCVPLATAATAFAAVYGVADGLPTHTHTTAFIAIMMGAQVMWGIAYAVYGGTQQALMADSTPAQGRAWYYTKLNQINLVASALGPCVAIGMFVLHGDQWDLLSLRNVLLAGLAIELPMCIPMLLYRDDCALLDQPDQATAAAPAPSGTNAAASSDDAAQERHVHVASAASVPCHSWAVPHLLFIQDITFALGSGMTVKFFPLFFKNDMHLSPVGVQTIWLINPLLMTAFNDLAERLARRIGRLPTMIGFKVVGISLLVTMALAKDWAAPRQMPPANTTASAALDASGDGGDYGSGGGGDGGGSASWHAMAKVVLMASIYLLRTSLMNSTDALEEAILMDFVPKATRARWKSLQNVTTFGWCGSAAIGGYLADRYDYATTFLVTAALQATGTLIVSSLLFIIPRSMDFEAGGEATTADPRATDHFGPAHDDTFLADFHVHPLPSGSIQRDVTTSTKSAAQSAE